MRSIRTNGSICLDMEGGIRFIVADIDYTEFEDESFRYEIRPNWPAIDLLGPPLFQGIPGLDLTLRREVYIRENQVPVFISERAPATNREGLWEQLDEVGMDYLNQLEWLIRTDTRYIGDRLYVVRQSEHDDSPFDVNEAIAAGKNSEHSLRMLLEAFARGCPIIQDASLITLEQRKAMFSLARGLFMKSWSYRESKKLEGIRKASAKGRYAGRKPIGADELVLSETLERYEHGLLTAKQAADSLGMSVPTFYRRLAVKRGKSSSCTDDRES